MKTKKTFCVFNYVILNLINIIVNHDILGKYNYIIFPLAVMDLFNYIPQRKTWYQYLRLKCLQQYYIYMQASTVLILLYLMVNYYYVMKIIALYRIKITNKIFAGMVFRFSQVQQSAIRQSQQQSAGSYTTHIIDSKKRFCTIS